MQYRQLGNSDLEISEIALGSWLTYGVGVEARQARPRFLYISHKAVFPDD